MELAFNIIPIKLQTNVFSPAPILADFVFFFEYSHEVVGVFLSNVLYAEVIYHIWVEWANSLKVKY